MNVSFHVVVLVVFFFTSGVATVDAQKLPNIPVEMLKLAEKNFEAAYKLEFGEDPPKDVVKKAMATYVRVVTSMPTQLGTREGQEAKRLGSLRKGFANLDGPALLDVLSEMRFDSLIAFGFTKPIVAKLAEPEMPINQFDGRALVKDPSLILDVEDNTEIVFPAGTYTLDERTIGRIISEAGKKFPEGITFVGDSKETTNLKLTNAGFTRRDVNCLGFRDMTIDCSNDGLFDKRQGTLVLRMSNVRLVRFDAGHGGCRLFSINDGLIVHAVDCEFIGGLGRSPGNGSIFDSSKILLGHFERCSFFGINYELFRAIRERSSLLWMDDCKFDRKYADNTSVKLKRCKTDAKVPAIEWSPQEDSKIGDLGG